MTGEGQDVKAGTCSAFSVNVNTHSHSLTCPLEEKHSLDRSVWLASAYYRRKRQNQRDRRAEAAGANTGRNAHNDMHG